MCWPCLELDVGGCSKVCGCFLPINAETALPVHHCSSTSPFENLGLSEVCGVEHSGLRRLLRQTNVCSVGSQSAAAYVSLHLPPAPPVSQRKKEGKTLDNPTEGGGGREERFTLAGSLFESQKTGGATAAPSRYSERLGSAVTPTSRWLSQRLGVDDFPRRNPAISLVGGASLTGGLAQDHSTAGRIVDSIKHPEHSVIRPACESC